jgi:aspartyl/asparaginyl beta-hydroxylase (cupin superfamily)
MAFRRHREEFRMNDMSRIASVSAAPAVPRRPFILRAGKRIRRQVDAIVARSSRVPNDPVVDPALFPWTQILRGNWQAIRQEALAVTRDENAVPALRKVSPDHARIAEDDRWRSFFLIG